MDLSLRILGKLNVHIPLVYSVLIMV